DALVLIPRRLARDEALSQVDLLGRGGPAPGGATGGGDDAGLIGPVPGAQRFHPGARTVERQAAVEQEQRLRRGGRAEPAGATVVQIRLVEGVEERKAEVALGEHVDRSAIPITGVGVRLP